MAMAKTEQLRHIMASMAPGVTLAEVKQRCAEVGFSPGPTRAHWNVYYHVRKQLAAERESGNGEARSSAEKRTEAQPEVIEVPPPVQVDIPTWPPLGMVESAGLPWLVRAGREMVNLFGGDVDALAAFLESLKEDA